MSNAAILKPMPMTVLSGTNTVSGYAVSNLGNDFLGVVWKSQNPSGTTSSFIVDMGADVAVDTLVLIGLTGAVSSWTLTVQAATQAQGSGFGGGAYYAWPAVSLLAGATMPRSGRGRAYWEAPAGGPAAARYWKVIVTTAANNTPVTVARAVLGQRIVPAHNFDFGAAFGVRDMGGVEWSRRGVMKRARGMKLRSVGLSFAALHRDEVEGFIHPLIEAVGGTGPIVLVRDPAADAERQNRIWFGLMIGDVGTVWARPNAGWKWQANVVDLESYAGDA